MTAVAVGVGVIFVMSRSSSEIRSRARWASNDPLVRYWARHENWDQMKASLQGCSYYKLPSVLKWITGNIGLHHIHHVRPQIPNYNLQQCYNEVPALQEIIPLKFCKSLRTPWLNLWDEEQNKLVSFRALKMINREGAYHS